MHIPCLIVAVDGVLIVFIHCIMSEDFGSKHIGVIDDLLHMVLVLTSPCQLLHHVLGVRSQWDVVYPWNKTIIVPFILFGGGFEENGI